MVFARRRHVGCASQCSDFRHGPAQHLYQATVKCHGQARGCKNRLRPLVARLFRHRHPPATDAIRGKAAVSVDAEPRTKITHRRRRAPISLVVLLGPVYSHRVTGKCRAALPPVGLAGCCRSCRERTSDRLDGRSFRARDLTTTPTPVHKRATLSRRPATLQSHDNAMVMRHRGHPAVFG